MPHLFSPDYQHETEISMITIFAKKNAAIWLTALLLLCFFCGIGAMAAQPVSIDLVLPASAAENGVYAGKVLTPSVSVAFDEFFLAESEGIIAVQFGLKFDPEKLQPVDVYGYTPITFDEAGTAMDGLPFLFGTIAVESRFSCILKNNDTLVCTYFSSTDTSHDIVESGILASFAFRVSDSLTIDTETSTRLELTNPYIGVSKKDADFVLLKNDANVKILPPIKVGMLGESRIGDTAAIVGQHFIDKSSTEPLTMTITRGGESVEPARDLPISGTFINELIALDEAVYEPGAYTISFAYKNMTAHVYMEVQPKVVVIVPTPSPTPLPAPPEEDETDAPEDLPSPSPEPTETPTPSAPPAETPTATPSVSPETPPSTTPQPSPAPSTGNTTGYRPGGGNSLVPTGTPDAPHDTEDGDAPVYPTDTENHWADANIKYVYDHALMNGYEDGTFRPGNSITRAEFAAVMSRFLGLLPNQAAAAQFTDCTAHWALGYIGALAEKGIVGGVSETEFAPDSNITREQIAVILSRAFGLTAAETQKYTDDADISSWAYDGVYSVRTAGYMTGDENGRFLPKSPATRAEVATIICRLHQNQ